MKNVITRVKGSQPAPILLVANKFDLDCQREVTTAEGKYHFNSYEDYYILMYFIKSNVFTILKNFKYRQTTHYLHICLGLKNFAFFAYFFLSLFHSDSNFKNRTTR